MRARKTLLTAEELFRLSSTGRRYELVKGELFEMPPAGGRHGSVAMRIGILLGSHVRASQLGEVFAAETGFILRRSPDTVRAPDASFVSKERLPAGELPVGFLETAPDLAVEVVSPGDSARDVLEKVEEWLGAGVRLVWIICPATRSVTAYHSLEDFRELSERDSLDGAEVVPGFTCRIRDLFY
jgi:Uma2 family endonuclease